MPTYTRRLAKEWNHCFNSVTDSARLEENLAEFFKEAKTVRQGTEISHTQTEFSHHHSGRDSFGIDNKDSVKDERTYRMQPTPHAFRNRTSIHGHELLKK